MCFPYAHPLSYIGHVTGLPASDFLLIALSEFLGFLCFLIVRDGHYRHKIIAYDGDNQNVAQWIRSRRPRNRIDQYLRRILNRLETEHDFTVFPFYVNSPHNEMCDQLSHFSLQRRLPGTQRTRASRWRMSRMRPNGSYLRGCDCDP